MWVGTSDIKFYLRGPGSMRSGIGFEIKVNKFRGSCVNMSRRSFVVVVALLLSDGRAEASRPVIFLTYYAVVVLGGGEKRMADTRGLNSSGRSVRLVIKNRSISRHKIDSS